MQDADSGATLKPGEAARTLGITTTTLASLAERGYVRAIKLPSGHRRYVRSDIEALADKAAS